MPNHKVKCSNFEIANDKPFTLIAGPCQLENEDHALKISTELKKITSKLEINLIYKTSFDKANRTSLKGERGAGLEASLPIFDKIKKDTLAYKLYGSDRIKERHRHRYEVDIKYKEILESKGMIFSGLSPDGKLPEIVEINEFVLNEKTVKHPYFIAGQFHPEFNSSPFNPHPMFKGLVKAALDIRLKERIN